MPELPEAERARAAIAERALGRRIAAVDDRDAYVTRPHSPGEIAAALTGRKLVTANRIGKTLWAETDGEAPDLGLHLGMAGRIAIDEEPHPVWDRFALTFDDGGRLALQDKRRLGRAVLDPDLSHLGPDAAEATRDEFRERVGAGTAPIKARLMDQGAVAGIGNLIADEILWDARIDPRRPASDLSDDELDALRRSVRAVVRRKLREGAGPYGPFTEARGRDGHCPRCGAPLERARIGGRTTYWCPREQR